MFSPAERDRPAWRRSDPSYPAFSSAFPDQVTISYWSGPVHSAKIALTAVKLFSASAHCVPASVSSIHLLHRAPPCAHTHTLRSAPPNAASPR